MPGRQFYVVATHDLQREIMNDKRADKPIEVYGKFNTPGYPAGLFTRRTKDPVWKTSRKCAAPSFSRKEVGRMNSVCNKHLRHWITERLEGTFLARDEPFDPSKEMTFLTFSTILEAGFEYVPTPEECDAYIQNLSTYLKEFGLKQLANPFRRPFGWFFQGYRDAMKAETRNISFRNKIVEHYRANPNKSTNNTLIKMLTENETIKNDRSQIVAEIGTFIAGGFDTTGYTLSTTLTLIAKHPDIARKIRIAQSELDDPLNEVSNYLGCVIKESRRYLSVAAMGTSRQFDTVTKFGGYDIPANSILLLPQMLPHRDGDVYGPDPDSFRPERWLQQVQDTGGREEEEEEKLKSLMNSSLITFATGNRNCVGQALAVSELESVLPHLLTKYEFTIEKEGSLEHFLTLKYSGTLLKAKKIAEKE